MALQVKVFYLCVVIATAATACTRGGFVTPCDAVDCDGHGRCLVSVSGAAVCHCEPGFQNSGPRRCVAEVTWPCAADICPDASFGESGNRVLDVNGVDNIGWCAHSVAVQDDSKIVVAANTSLGPDEGLFVARFLDGGSLDPSFGEAGVAVIQLGATNASTHSVSIYPDGRILVAGSIQLDVRRLPFLLRLLGDGELDLSFGSEQRGYAVVDLPEVNWGLFNGHVILADESIVAGGHADIVDSSISQIVVRVAADGRGLVSSFGDGGRIIMGRTGSDHFGIAPLLDEQDRILFNGSGRNTDFDFSLSRHLATGVADQSFADAGYLYADFGSSDDYCAAMMLDQAGLIVSAGNSSDDGDQWRFALTRHTAAGVLDESFGTAGKQIISARATGALHGLVQLDDARYLLVGEETLAQRRAVLVLIHNDGRLDTSFADQGYQNAQLPDNQGSGFCDVVLDRRGRVLVIGDVERGGQNDVVLSRYVVR